MLTISDSAQPGSSPRSSSRSTQAIRVVSFALVLATVMAAGAVAYFTERGIVSGRDWVIHSYQVRSQLSDLQIEIIRARDSEMTSMLTHDGVGLSLSREQANLAGHTVEELRRLTRDNPRQQERLNQLGPLLNEGMSLIETQ